MDHYKLLILLIISAILGLGIIIIPDLPRLLSYQDPIDPVTIQNYQAMPELAFFNNRLISAPSQPPTDQPIMGVKSDSSKRIEVDLTNQTLTAYDDDQLIYKFIISSGKWDRTPTGTFTIWTKVRSQKMSGGSKELGTYYYLPNVPYILFFSNQSVPKQQGYSLHGTYWHDNFGIPMSHGCINMNTAEVAQIYNWAEVGTPVIIYGKYRTVLPSAAISPAISKNL